MNLFHLTLRTKIGLAILLSSVGYLLFALWFPLHPYFDTLPQLDIRAFSPSLLAGLGYGLLLLGLFGLFWRLFRHLQHDHIPAIFVFALPLAWGLLLLNTYPINATDIYRYFIRGRVQAVYGQTQFAVPPNAIPDDPFAPFAGEWAFETTPYGPVWEAIATAVAAVVQENLFAGLIAFKLIGLAAHLGTGWTIWRIMHKRSLTTRTAYTWLWTGNPALLLTFVVNGHNDGLMLFWLMLGVWFIYKNRAWRGLMLMVLGALTKPIGLIALPFWGIAVLRRLPNWGARLRLTAMTTVSTLALIWLTFLPFGSPFNLVIRLSREALLSGGFSIMALLVIWLQQMGDLAVETIRLLIQFAQGTAVCIILWLLWRTLNGRSAPAGTANSFGTYFAQAFSFRLWYATWLLPWAIVSETDESQLSFRLRVVLWFLVTTQLSPLIYGHLWAYALGGSYLAAHAIGVPFTFLLPFLLARKRH